MAEFEKHRFFGRQSGYKFCDSTNAGRILDEGSVRIGTLKEFRELESSSLKDQNEGINSQLATEEIKHHETHSSSLVRGIIGDETGSTTFQNVGFSTSFDFPTFCFTYEFNEKTYRSLCDENNHYDTCVEIVDLHSFGNLVAKQLSAGSKKNVGYFCLPVLYGEISNSVRDAPFSAANRAFRKAGIFNANAEGRLIFLEADREEFGYPFVKLKDNGINFISSLRHLVRRVEIPPSWSDAH
jgi:hypothetical protein